ncbi:MAG: type II toxin-antitoxin system RelE/ParE family toxin [Bryobacterales bacterium]|nr:type II toxin-antitoxin system RelE/ParE family toxin [Bryobacterales bacterium]
MRIAGAQDWYESDASGGAGRRFRLAVDALVDRISHSPRQFPVVYKSVRRALVRRFPYALFFLVEENGAILVIACFHCSRDPLRWQQRV